MRRVLRPGGRLLFVEHGRRTSAPTSADGIERYLSSGMIHGVGPVYAKKLVRAFGDRWQNAHRFMVVLLLTSAQRLENT